MKKHFVKFLKEWKPSYATYWVHIEVPPVNLSQTLDHTPALQKSIKGLGYPRFFIIYDGLELEFSSLEEIEHYIQILSKKNLPTTLSLTKIRKDLTPKIVSFEPYRSQWYVGPNKHWLSRLPAKFKPWSFREGLVKYLKTCLKNFKKEIA